MASTPRTPNKNSNNSMSGWVVFSIIGHLMLLLILSAFGPTTLTRKTSTPLQKKQLVTQKALFDEQNKRRLAAKLDQMITSYKELLDHRDRRVEQYKVLEEKMQSKVPELFSRQAPEALSLQQHLVESFTNATAQYDSFQTAQQQIKEDLEHDDFQRATEHLSNAQFHLQQYRHHIDKSLTDLEYSNVRLDDFRETLAWFNDDSLLVRLAKIKRLQAELRTVLTQSRTKLHRHETLWQKKVPRINKDAKELADSDNSSLKRWSVKQRMKSLTKNLDKNQTKQYEKQQKKSQGELKSVVDKARKQLALGLPSTQFPQRSSAAEEGSNMSSMFLSAQNLRRQTAELFAESRAVELALLQNRSYSSTAQEGGQDTPFFSDDDAFNLPENISSNETLMDYQKSFEMAAQDMDLILADIQAMRQKASSRTSISDSGLTNIHMAMRRQADQQERLQQLAGPQGQRVQDLSRDMYRLLHSGQTMALPASANEPPSQMRLSMEHYGRKITSYGRPVESFYIDSWYMIGPFPNSHRQHINDMFPPETIIDLDAEYPGKRGPVRWEYCSSPTHFIKPIHYVEYGIYYAYTQLFAEDAQAVWMAFGSDDRLDVWINDIKVWQSSNTLKQWRPDEGYRKVYLQKGYNVILARLENGYRECGFSVIVALN